MKKYLNVIFAALFVFFICTFFVVQSNAFVSKKIAFPKDTKADKILIEKEKRQLYLLKNGKKLKNYRISLGFNPVGHKEKQGDGKTPEGLYKIELKNPNSNYHFSLKVSYPNKTDREHAKEMGVSPGGDIMIHGLPNGFNIGNMQRMVDWTAGCIAVTNNEIEEIEQLVDVGTPIEILP